MENKNHLSVDLKQAFSHFNRIVTEKMKNADKSYFLDPITKSNRYCSKDSYSYRDILFARDNRDILLMRSINKFYYETNTSYRRIIEHFARIYKYYYTLDLKGISKENSRMNVETLYNNCLNLLDNFNIPDTFGEITKKVLLQGVYFGYLTYFPDNRVVLTELPPEYCRANTKSPYGTYIVQFNLGFFKQYSGKTKIKILEKFPDEIRRAYADNRGEGWVQFPTEKACAFFLDEDFVPPFFDSLIDILNFDVYKDIEKERDSQELEKILVQRFNRDEDGETDEFLSELGEIHGATAEMLSGAKNVDLLTSIADQIELLDTKSANRAAQDNIRKMLLPKYESAGVSYEVFSSTGATSLEKSLQNTASFVSQLIEKYAQWLSMICYSKFNFEKLIPIVTILPITWYNEDKMRDKYLKDAQFGFSWILPYVAAGKKQSTLLDTVYLEQDILKLKDKMRPLTSSYTETDNNGEKQKNKEYASPGRPQKSNEDRAEQTIANINSQ